MTYSLDLIASTVCALLDENPEIAAEKTAYADPGASILSLVRLFLPDAARIAAASAPVSEIEECARLGESPGSPDGSLYCPEPVEISPGNLWMKLPYGFLRLLWFRMSDWKCAVTEPLAFGGYEHALRRHPGGNRHRHCTAVAIRQQGPDRALEIFGSSKAAHVADFGWLTVPLLTDDSIDIPKGLLMRVCEKTADMIRLNLRQ